MRQVFSEEVIRSAFTDGLPLWADFCIDGQAEYYYDPHVEAWRSAEEMLLDLEADALIEEYEATQAELETRNGRWKRATPT